jgi:hypothetical protein
MKKFEDSRIGRAVASQDGQVLPWLALMMVLFLGFAGITIDLGRAWVSYRELQASTDAAALAGAYAMTQTGATTSSVINEACLFSSNTKTQNSACSVAGTNTTPNLPNVTTTPTPKCVSQNAFVPVACAVGPGGNNVILVEQTVSIPTYFIRGLAVFGINSASSLTLNAYSTATIVGSSTQLNVAVIVDTTASMGQQDTDASCNNSRIHCALAGVQTMLGQLTPCGSTSTKTNCVGFDQVSLFTFPNVTANTVSDDTTCGSGNPTIVPYTLPAQPASGNTTWTPPTGTAGTYQITTYLDNYSSTNGQGGSPNESSGINVATGAGGCNGMQTPGGDGTYYAGVINAAQTSLMAAAAANLGSENIMIILSDGDANATSAKIAGNKGATSGSTIVYGSTNDQCQQAIQAAQNASTLGTTVYTVAYGAESSGCSTDTSGSMAGLSPCTSMKYMSSGYATGNTSHFYSSNQSGTEGQCPSSGPNNLTDIFSAITASFSKARLVPLSVLSGS